MPWLKNTYVTQISKNLHSLQAPQPVNNPTMALFNNALATELGIAEYLKDDKKALGYLSGNEKIPESRPIA